MIRQDSISKLLIILALMFSVYLATFETTTLILFPAILLIIGLVMEIFLEKKQEFVNHITEPESLKTIGFYTIIALAGIFLSGYMINYSQVFQLNVISAIGFSVLMAVAEEQFFRGFITDFLLSRFPSGILACLSSAGIFAIYHLARYGTNQDAFLYVLAGGFVLSWVAWRSKRISPCMLAHAINNAIAVIGVMMA